MARPSRITAFLAVALTACLIAASVGIFVALNHSHSGGSAASKITPTPTHHGPPTMPNDILELNMVSDHEGWAIQGSGSDDPEHLVHFHNGTWQTVPLPGLMPVDSLYLAMASASDGWIIHRTGTDSQDLFHYNGTVWNQVALPTLPAHSALATFSFGANGDDWLAGESGNPGLNMLSERHLTTYGALSSIGGCDNKCLPLLLHFVGGRWTEVTVPAGLKINPDSLSMGWFLGNDSDPKALYHYQHGSWSRVSLNIATAPTSFVMVSPTEGWISTASSPSGGTDTWSIYHFDGKTVRRIAQKTIQHCGYETPILSAFAPGDIWVSLPDSHCSFLVQQFWHIQGGASTMVSFPSPYNYPDSNVMGDPNGNLWMLISHAVGTPFTFEQEAILRWNGSQWVIFAQTQG